MAVCFIIRSSHQQYILKLEIEMGTLWKRYREVLVNLWQHHPALFYMHIFFVGAATLTLVITILSSL